MLDTCGDMGMLETCGFGIDDACGMVDACGMAEASTPVLYVRVGL